MKVIITSKRVSWSNDIVYISQRLDFIILMLIALLENLVATIISTPLTQVESLHT